ncbi:hypothetical protein S245_043785, partial [Arachis hypogaea]
ADICDSSDDEIDISNLLTQAANQQTICQNPKGKAITKTKLPDQTHPLNLQPSKIQTTYISKKLLIKHYKDPKDSTNITHSTIQILK